jgi:hypothetical protein
MTFRATSIIVIIALGEFATFCMSPTQWLYQWPGAWRLVLYLILLGLYFFTNISNRFYEWIPWILIAYIYIKKLFMLFR